MLNYFKYHILHQPLALTKTHDHGPKKHPKLTVVFLHGIADSSRCYHNTLKFLEGTTTMKDVRFIAYDWLGHGKSYANDHLEYTYDEQLSALQNSLEKAKATAPIVLVGHSLGTLLATRYAITHKKSIAKLILFCPPVFTREEIEFLTAKPEENLFMKKISPKIAKQKYFINSMMNVAMNVNNYKMFEKLTTPTVMLYDKEDWFISAKNIKALEKANAKYISTFAADGKHRINRTKYAKALEILEELQ